MAAFLADAPRLLTPCLDVPLDALLLEADPPWRLPRDQAEVIFPAISLINTLYNSNYPLMKTDKYFSISLQARWISWAAPASTATDTTYLSTEGNVPLDTDSFLP